MKLEKHEMYKVSWNDSVTTDGWHNPGAQAYEPIICETVGFLVAEDERSISLAGSVIWGEHHQTCSVMTIPRPAIESIAALTATQRHATARSRAKMTTRSQAGNNSTHGAGK